MSLRLYTDLESIPDQREGAFERYLDQVKPPGQYKKQDSIDKWLAENAEAEAEKDYLKTGLTGLHGEICSIAFALDDSEIIQVGRTNMGHESELLLEFWDELGAMAEKLTPGGQMPRLQWIGHNVIDFDLRFLKQRSIVNGIKPPFLVPADAKHGGDWVFDTMKEWAGWRGYVKQDELIEALGIEVPDTIAQDVDGSMVWDLFKAGEFETIAEYNRLDVWRVREIYRRMTFAEERQ